MRTVLALACLAALGGCVIVANPSGSRGKDLQV